MLDDIKALTPVHDMSRRQRSRYCLSERCDAPKGLVGWAVNYTHEAGVSLEDVDVWKRAVIVVGLVNEAFLRIDRQRCAPSPRVEDVVLKIDRALQCEHIQAGVVVHQDFVGASVERHSRLRGPRVNKQARLGPLAVLLVQATDGMTVGDKEAAVRQGCDTPRLLEIDELS